MFEYLTIILKVALPYNYEMVWLPCCVCFLCWMIWAVVGSAYEVATNLVKDKWTNIGNIYSSLLTPEGMDSSKNKTCRGRTFHFPRSTGQFSAKRSEARQSWRSRKGKSWPKESFVLTRIQFPSGVRCRGYIFLFLRALSTRRSRIDHGPLIQPLYGQKCTKLPSRFLGVPLKIAGRRPAIFQ